MTADRSADEAQVRARLDRYLAVSGLAGRSSRIVALTGDASDRRYFRVIANEGGSMVLAVHTGAIDFETLPFAVVASILREMPLPIPQILGHDDAEGIVAQSDLGDVTLQAHLETVSATERMALYRQAVGFIEVVQRRGAELASGGALPYRMAFDVDKLTWEMNFFVTHFLEAYRRVSLTPPERAALDAEWAALVGELAAEPRVLCHRDYHSRNLMYSGGHLHVIDFQDARMGPDTYDLASLLRDSYVDLSDHDVEALIGVFLALRYGATSSMAEFRRRFDLMSVQRNIKALGTFGYQTTTRDNHLYRQYMPRTLAHVRRNLERYPRFERLRTLLSAHVDELR